MINKLKKYIFIMILSVELGLFINTEIYAQETGERIRVEDIRSLEEYEQQIIHRLLRREETSTPGKRIDVKFQIYAGGGGILAVGGIKSSFKFGFMATAGTLINFAALKNLSFIVEAGIISMKAVSRNTVVQGASTYIVENDDGKLSMIPILFGVEYRFDIAKIFSLSPQVLFGMSFNHISLPSRVNEDNSVGYDARSNDITLKFSLKGQFHIAKGFSVKVFFDFLFIKEAALNGTFLSFGVIADYRF